MGPYTYKMPQTFLVTLCWFHHVRCASKETQTKNLIRFHLLYFIVALFIFIFLTDSFMISFRVNQLQPWVNYLRLNSLLSLALFYRGSLYFYLFTDSFRISFRVNQLKPPVDYLGLNPLLGESIDTHHS